MEIVSILYGFFLKKDILNPEETFYDLKKTIKDLNKDFSVPEQIIKDLDDDFPLLDASSKNGKIKLIISKKRILIEFLEETQKKLEKAFKNEEKIVNNILNFILNRNKINRIGLVVKIFIKSEGTKFIEGYFNKEKVKDKLRDVRLRYNKKREINKISLNDILDMVYVHKKQKKKIIRGILIKKDINNLKTSPLKKGKEKDFLNSLKKIMIEEVKW